MYKVVRFFFYNPQNYMSINVQCLLVTYFFHGVYEKDNISEASILDPIGCQHFTLKYLQRGFEKERGSFIINKKKIKPTKNNPKNPHKTKKQRNKQNPKWMMKSKYYLKFTCVLY